MKYLLISFKTKNSVYSFSSKLKLFNIANQIINTPSSISKSCSLSLRTDLKNLTTILKLISSSNYNDLIGLFLVEIWGFNERINRLYWLFKNFLLSYYYDR